MNTKERPYKGKLIFKPALRDVAGGSILQVSFLTDVMCASWYGRCLLYEASKMCSDVVKCTRAYGGDVMGRWEHQL
jgi:hypothetical protein